MNTKIKYIPYKICSKNRASGDDINDFNIYINGLDQIQENYQIHLKNFRINNDFLNINSNNNIINIYNETGTADVSITIPIENYNATQFITEFNLNTLDLVASFNTQNNLISILNNSLSEYTFTITEKQKFLGLSTGTHTLLSTQTLISNQPADFSGPTEINVNIENIQLESYTTENYNNNILATIPVNVSYNEKLIYNNDYPVTSNTRNITRLHVRLTDENQDLIQTRSDYTILLQFIDTQVDP